MAVVPLPPELVTEHDTPPPGFWQREPSHFPLPVSPFTKVLWRQEEWASQICAQLGSLIDTIRFVEIGGWVYMQIVPFGPSRGPRPPDWLIPVLTRVLPPLHRRMAAARKALRTDWPGRQVDAWHTRRRAEIEGSLASARAVELPELSDAELDDHLRGVVELAHGSLLTHFTLHFAMGHTLGTFAATCRELFAWDDARSMSALAGTSTTSTAPARALTELTALAAGSPEVRRLLPSAPVQQVLDADPAFAEAFHQYLEDFCFRALTYDLADPTLYERPELVLNLIRDQLALGDAPRPAPGSGAADIEWARGRLRSAQPSVRERFERDLARALRAYPVREDNVYLTVSAPVALLRFAALEIGRRLVDRGLIPRAQDVVLLHADEARRALLEARDENALIAERLARRERVLAHPGPPTYGPDPGPPPSLAGIPEASRTLTEMGLWLIELITSEEPARPADRRCLTGVGAARGQASGTVRVVLDESAFDKLQAGDVLVCPCTSPPWSIVFPSLSAVVTDSGGVLSHPAIVAREFGIPAVVGTGHATSLLVDGQQVRVDGTAGTVTVLGP